MVRRMAFGPVICGHGKWWHVVLLNSFITIDKGIFLLFEPAAGLRAGASIHLVGKSGADGQVRAKCSGYRDTTQAPIYRNIRVLGHASLVPAHLPVHRRAPGA